MYKKEEFQKSKWFYQIRATKGNKEDNRIFVKLFKNVIKTGNSTISITFSESK